MYVSVVCLFVDKISILGGVGGEFSRSSAGDTLVSGLLGDGQIVGHALLLLKDLTVHSL